MSTPSHLATRSWPRQLRFLVALMCGAVLSAYAGGSSAASPSSAPEPNLSEPRSSARMFFSGHSLLDDPLPEYVASIAKSLGTPAWWNEQNHPGSTIAARTRGNAAAGSASFPGYSVGKNRDGSGMNVVSELRQPKTIGGQRYDTLVLTERHDIMNTLIWEDTVRYARHFHERLIEGNPQANTYLYHSWLDVDKSNPGRWVAYERAVAPAWQCVASRINQSLQAEGRSDRVVYLPAGLALTRLVEQATQGTGVAGLTGVTVRETVNRIFSDDVHLTPVGVYYMALVTYASVYRRSPAGAWAPAGVVTAEQAQSLQAVAWQVVSSHFNSYRAPDLAQCRAAMVNSVCPAYWKFANRSEPAGVCSKPFAEMTQTNPFYFNASTDRSYWFPAP
ncbi:MAG: hypothetical protein QM740_02125 [Acidovorax sp.]